MVERVGQVPRVPPFTSARNIMALVLREMGTSSGRIAGGYLWAILEPAGGIALLTVAFSLLFRSPPLGTSFPIFYATGVLPFLFYTDISNKLAQAIRFSKPLLFYPRLTFADALLARLGLAILTQAMVFCVVTGGLLVTEETRVHLDISSVLLGLAMVVSLAFGIGTLNCFLFGMFPVWTRIWSILNRPLFIISCVFFTFESVPRPFQDYLWYNPLVHIIGQVRSGFYPTYEAEFVSYVYVFGLAGVLATGGLLLLHRYHRDLLDL